MFCLAVYQSDRQLRLPGVTYRNLYYLQLDDSPAVVETDDQWQNAQDHNCFQLASFHQHAPPVLVDIRRDGHFIILKESHGGFEQSLISGPSYERAVVSRSRDVHFPVGAQSGHHDRPVLPLLLPHEVR